MPGKKSVVRKLTLVVIAIVTLVIAAAGLVNNAISHHYALESAREVLKFNSESILNGIHKLMLSRNNEGVLEMIRSISKDSTVYREIRLVSHYSGEVVVSRLGEGGATLTEEDRPLAGEVTQALDAAIIEAREALVTMRSSIDALLTMKGISVTTTRGPRLPSSNPARARTVSRPRPVA